MASRTHSDTDSARTPLVNVAELESLGREVVSGMRAMRELLAARTTALEECRNALLEFQSELTKRHEELERQEQALCEHYEKREADLTARERHCGELTERFGTESARLESAQAELARQRSELEPRLTAAGAREAELNERCAALASQEEQAAAAAAELEARSRAMENDLARIQIVEVDLSERTEQLAARSAELETRRMALAAREEEQPRAAQEAAQRQADLEARRTELEQREVKLEHRRAKLDAEKADLDRARSEAAATLTELQAAREQFAGLQKQLEEELNALSEQKGELLVRYGRTENDGAGRTKPNAPLPKLPDQKASASLERFQKLCRDAKRKAIGAT